MSALVERVIYSASAYGKSVIIVEYVKGDGEKGHLAIPMSEEIEKQILSTTQKHMKDELL